MPELNIKVTADTQAAKANLNSLATNVNDFAQELRRMAAVTPEMAKLGDAFQKIQQDFQEGKISIDQAREAIDKIEAEIKEMGGTVDKSEKDVKGFSESWTELKSQLDIAIGAARLVGDAFQEAFELGKEGAQLKDTTESLERLAQASGYTGDILKDLEHAAGGTVDDMAYMGSTIRLLTGETGKLAKSLAMASPQLLEIARAAVKLNPTLGDTASAYEAITRAIETGQTRALKNYGIVLEDVENKEDALNQVLAAGNILIQQVGGNVETAVDDYSRMENSVDNLKDSLTTLINEMGIVQSTLTPLATQADALTAVLQAQKEGVISGAEAFTLFSEALIGTETAANVLDHITDKIEMATVGTLAFSDAQNENAQRLAETVTWGGDLADMYSEQHILLAQQVEDYTELWQAEDEAAARTAKLNENIAKTLETIQDTAPKLQEMNDILNQDVGSPLADFISDLQFFIASGGRDFVAEFEGIKTALAVKLAAEDTTPGQAALAVEDAKIKAAELIVEWGLVNIELGKETEIGLAKSLSETLGVSIDEAKGLIADFDKNAEAVFGKEYEVLLNTVSMEDKLAATGENIAGFGETAVEDLAPVSDMLDAISGEHNVFVHVSVTGAKEAAKDLAFIIPKSPPPLVQGIQMVIDILPQLSDAFGELGDSMPWSGGTDDIDTWIEKLVEGIGGDAVDALDDLTNGLIEAAGAFSDLGNAASSIINREMRGMEDRLDEISDAREKIIAELETENLHYERQQELTAELAGLDAEREQISGELQKRQEAILHLQEQQQRLRFLEQQFKFLEYLQQYGIDPASVLGGLQLGAGADPTALAEAMAAALEKIIAQLSGTIGQQNPGLGFQHGADFIVPPGYPHDSYGPMWASSGEHVSVSTTGGGSMPITIDLRGAFIGSQAEFDRMLNAGLRNAGRQANAYRLTR